MRRATGAAALPLTLALGALLVPRPASAGFAETLPEGTFLLDVSYAYSWLRNAWDDHGGLGPLVAAIDRYEPGGGKQGTLIPGAFVQYHITIFQLQYGILDNLSVGIGIPLVARTSISPDLKWIPGDYQPQLGRPYGEDDFWQWAASMGQPRPGEWVGNEGVPGDVVLGLRLRWSDWIEAFREAGVAASLSVYGALPTGVHADPEEVVSAGTTMWDLQAQGDLGVHLGFDKTFHEELDDRLTLGLDVFYEWFAPHRYDTPTGTKNPLLLSYQPYAGTSYMLDPGDLVGFSVQVDGVPVRGPSEASFISGWNPLVAESFPPLLTLSLRYTFSWIGQTRFDSMSDLWDFQQEDHWRPGYRNALSATVLFSFLRLGAPLQVYASYRTLSLIPGRNTRAADVLTAGIRIPAKFW
jgi:hypothetical protein